MYSLPRVLYSAPPPYTCKPYLHMQSLPTHSIPPIHYQLFTTRSLLTTTNTLLRYITPHYPKPSSSGVVGCTNMNAQSSRSHAIFTVTIERSDVGADKQQHLRVGKLHLVDLAVSKLVVCVCVCECVCVVRVVTYMYSRNLIVNKLFRSDSLLECTNIKICRYSLYKIIINSLEMC